MKETSTPTLVEEYATKASLRGYQNDLNKHWGSHLIFYLSEGALI